MATELGKAYVQIIPSAKGISGSISKVLDGEVTSAGQSAGLGLGSSLVSALTGAIAAAGIGKLISSSLMAGADLQQSFGGIETLYGDAANAAKDYAREAYKAGISSNTYAEQAVSMGAALKQSLGGDSVAAAKAANMAILDMADNAAKMGTPIESLQMAYQGFAKQNYTMLDNLKIGYGGTKSEMERLLADAEKLTGVKYDISNLSDVYHAIHAVQEELNLTGVAADEAKNTFHGSFAAMKAAWSNTMAGLALGEDIKPALQGLAQTASDFLFRNFIPMVGNILKGLPVLVGTLLKDGLAQIVTQAFGSEVSGRLMTEFTKIQEVVISFYDMIFGSQSKKDNVDLLTSLGITEGFAQAIVDTGETVRLFFENIGSQLQPLASGFQTAFGQLPTFFQGIAESVLPVFDAIVAGLGRLDFSGFDSLLTSILPALQAGFSQFMSIVGPAIEKVVSSFVNLWNAAQPLVAVLSEALMPAFQVAGSFLGGVFSGVLTGLSGLFDMLKIAIDILTPVVAWLVEGFKAAQPVLSWLGEKIGFLIGLFANFGSAGEGLRGMMQSAWSNIQSAIQSASSIIGSVIDWVKLAFSGAGSSAEVLKNIVSLAWMAMKDGISAASNIIQNIISAVKSAFSSFGNLVSSIGSGVSGVIGGITNTIRGLASIDISGAGAAIMHGFLNGLKSAWGAVTSFVGGIADWIRRNKGPISYDKKLLIPAGKAIMGGFNSSLMANFEEVKDTVRGMAPSLAGAIGTAELDMGLTTSGAALSGQDLVMSHQLAAESSTAQLVNRLEAGLGRLETLLGALVDKDTAVYLDGDTLVGGTGDRQKAYQDKQNRIYNRMRGIEAW